MVAVAAVRALTASPDTRASLFMVDLLPRHLVRWMRRDAGCCRYTGRSPGPPGGQQLSVRFFWWGSWHGPSLSHTQRRARPLTPGGPKHGRGALRAGAPPGRATPAPPARSRGPRAEPDRAEPAGAEPERAEPAEWAEPARRGLRHCPPAWRPAARSRWASPWG